MQPSCDSPCHLARAITGTGAAPHAHTVQQHAHGSAPQLPFSPLTALLYSAAAAPPPVQGAACILEGALRRNQPPLPITLPTCQVWGAASPLRWIQRCAVVTCHA